jgi:hypothetical protein
MTNPHHPEPRRDWLALTIGATLAALALWCLILLVTLP